MIFTTSFLHMEKLLRSNYLKTSKADHVVVRLLSSQSQRKQPPDLQLTDRITWEGSLLSTIVLISPLRSLHLVLPDSQETLFSLGICRIIQLKILSLDSSSNVAQCHQFVSPRMLMDMQKGFAHIDFDVADSAGKALELNGSELD